MNTHFELRSFGGRRKRGGQSLISETVNKREKDVDGSDPERNNLQTPLKNRREVISKEKYFEMDQVPKSDIFILTKLIK